MQLEGDPPDPVLVGEAGHLAPERDRRVPLSLEERDGVRGPRIPDPVDGRRAGPVARTAGHRDDLVDLEQLGQPDRLLDAPALLLADHRVEREARAVQRGDAQAATRERVTEPRPCPTIREQRRGIRVGHLGRPANGDLDRGRADVHGQVQGGLERRLGHGVGEQAKVHRVPAPRLSRRPGSRRPRSP